MPTDEKDEALRRENLSKMIEKALHEIKNRSEKKCNCRLRISGTPYLGTSCVEKEHNTLLPPDEREKARMMSIRPGIWRGAAAMWIIRCDVFCRDIINIVEEEFSKLVGHKGKISFLFPYIERIKTL